MKKLIDLIFPVSCTICGKLYSKSICPKCYISIKKEISFYTIKEKEFRVYFISFYEGKIKKLLLDFKFKDSAYINEFFVELFAKNEELKNIIKRYDYIIPVPMHKESKKIRGYNQTELLAQKITEKFNIKTINCLEKIKQNNRQSLLTEKERTENVKNVYKLKESNIENKKLILLDDIYTTGSTAKECIKELKKGSPKLVDVLVISKSKKG